MEEFINIKTEHEGELLVHYSTVYRNNSTLQWYWKGKEIKLDDNILEELEKLNVLIPSTKDLLINAMNRKLHG